MQQQTDPLFQVTSTPTAAIAGVESPGSQLTTERERQSHELLLLKMQQEMMTMKHAHEVRMSSLENCGRAITCNDKAIELTSFIARARHPLQKTSRGLFEQEQ
jgi:hypothetical protein